MVKQRPPAGNNFIAIAAGHQHSLALKSDGSIVGWGYNYYGQATPPAGNNFIAIAAGNSHSLALKSDGSIVGWGYNNYGQATPPAGNNFTAIAAGGYHSLALRRGPFSDLNSDAFVDFLDYSVFAKDWQQTPDPCDPNNGDITRDNQVNIHDLIELGESWLTRFVTPATNPMPADKATNTSRYIVLQWQPGENSTSHDVYFGTDFNEVNNADIDNQVVYMGNQYVNFWDTNHFTSNGLDFNSTYYWRIDEIASGYLTKGTVWAFKTGFGKAENPQPNNGQQYVTTHPILSWSLGTDAISHDVYFGTSYNDVNTLILQVRMFI